MRDFQIIAESAVHRGRRLLICSDGNRYIQLDIAEQPVQITDADFQRLQAMRHYHPVDAAMLQRAVVTPLLAD